VVVVAGVVVLLGNILRCSIVVGVLHGSGALLLEGRWGEEGPAVVVVVLHWVVLVVVVRVDFWTRRYCCLECNLLLLLPLMTFYYLILFVLC